MKIHQTIGLVAGVHALAFLLIFVSPGCSSTAKTDTSATQPASAPLATAPATAQAADTSASLVPAGGGPGPVFYTPTRPDTAAAEALTPAAPVADVTPAETYTVRSGDSLWLIAHRHHLKVSELAAANNLRSNASVHSGQKLLIPRTAGGAPSSAGARFAASAETPVAPEAGTAEAAGPARAPGGIKYTVKAGDKLSAIARHFGLTTGALAAENNISDPRKIRPGQVLTIPAAGAARKSGSHRSRNAASHPRETEAVPASAPATLEPVAPPAAPPESAPPASPSVPIVPMESASSSAPSSTR